MRLFALLSYYDEPVSWLAATVASLSRIGVDHLVAVDGAYIHYPHAKPCSPLEQADAVMRAADAVGIGCTLVRPNQLMWTEQQKRDYCFRILETMATPMQDWVTIIDADEVIVEGSPSWKVELDSLPDDTHCAAGWLLNRVDPTATNPTPNHTDITPKLHRTFELNTEYKTGQSRFWRCMHDMRVVTTHYTFTGRDDAGTVWNIRPDIDNSGVSDDLPQTDVATPMDIMPVFDHRDVWRTAARRADKRGYYHLRDELGLERKA